MRILDRYLSGQILGAVTWAVSLLTMILVLGNVLRDLLNLLLSHQVPVGYILTFIGYLLPFSLTYSIPWGVLVAVLLVFGKLSSDNELVALRANGVGMIRIELDIFGNDSGSNVGLQSDPVQALRQLLNRLFELFGGFSFPAQADDIDFRIRKKSLTAKIPRGRK